MKIKDIEVDIIIKYKNIKHVYFRVDEKNNLVVSAPFSMKEGEVKGIIMKKTDDIYKLYNSQKTKNNENKKFKYLGSTYEVKFIEELNKVGFKDNVVYAPSEKELNKFWEKECLKVFNGEVLVCKKCFRELPVFSIKTRKMKTRWGVCNIRKNEITLNTELLKYPLEVIDYVIIHELCHFFEANHSKDFWELVEGACPNYKKLRKDLKK